MSHFHKSKPDEIRVMRGLVTLFLFAATVIGAFYAVKTGNLILMGGLIVLPFGLILMNKPQLAFMLAVVVAPANIGVYREVDAGFLLRLIVCATFVMGFVFGQKPWKGETLPEKRPLLLLVGIVVMLMIVRGTGLRILGSRTWGGTVYIHILSAVFFFLIVNGLRLSLKQVKWIMWGTVAAGVIGSGVQYFGWATEAESGAYGAYRLSWLTPLAGALLALGFVALTRRSRLPGLVCWTGGLLAVAATGFRSRLVGMLMIIGAYGFFKVKSKGQYVAVGLACGLLLWGGVVSVSPMLPPGMQRAVSFVPGATVDYRVARNAQNSIDWRVEIWNYALERAPQYLLVGRGGAFDVLETVEQLSVMDPYGTPWQAFLTHTYHSGPIEMLVDYGIPGLLAVLWIHILIFRRMWRLSIRLAPLNTPVSRYLSYLCASQLWAAVAFYLVYGDVTGFTSWLVQAGIIMVLANSLLEAEEQQNELQPSA